MRSRDKAAFLWQGVLLSLPASEEEATHASNQAAARLRLQLEPEGIYRLTLPQVRELLATVHEDA